MTLTRAALREEIKKLDTALEPDSSSYVSACILMASAFVGANMRAVADLTGYCLDAVRKRAARLRKNGLWRGNRVFHSGWDDAEDGAWAFWLDVCIAEGLLKRVRK
jgi:hypothetical protein